MDLDDGPGGSGGDASPRAAGVEQLQPHTVGLMHVNKCRRCAKMFIVEGIDGAPRDVFPNHEVFCSVACSAADTQLRPLPADVKEKRTGRQVRRSLRDMVSKPTSAV